jgi:hypothetical protein
MENGNQNNQPAPAAPEPGMTPPQVDASMAPPANLPQPQIPQPDIAPQNIYQQPYQQPMSQPQPDPYAEQVSQVQPTPALQPIAPDQIQPQPEYSQPPAPAPTQPQPQPQPEYAQAAPVTQPMVQETAAPPAVPAAPPAPAPMPQASANMPPAPAKVAMQQPQIHPGQPSTSQAAIPSAQQIQDHAKKTILKIIGILTALSLAVVVLLFFVTGAADSSLESLKDAQNDRATYTVPQEWSEDTVGTFTAYYNEESLEASQATLLVTDPIRISFDSNRVTDETMDTIAADYRRTVNNDGSVMLSEPIERESEGFYRVIDFDVTGFAQDGVTEIRGVSRLLFDDNNFVHTVEFVSIRSYWESNSAQVLDIIDDYQLTGAQ